MPSIVGDNIIMTNGCKEPLVGVLAASVVLRVHSQAQLRFAFIEAWSAISFSALAQAQGSPIYASKSIKH